MNKNYAIERRDIISKTGVSILGVKRYDKVESPEGEKFIFLGVRDGEAYLERESKKDPVFIIIDTFDFERWNF